MNNRGFDEDRSIKVGQDINSSTVISGDGNVGVQGDRATITITNYYYRDSEVVTVESTVTGDEKLPCPYRGLFHFGPDDAEFFFGREVFVEELFEATQTSHFIPVLGASGSGKSSVVLAGLVPKLQQAGYWLFTHFRPGSDPFHALAESLVPLYTKGNATVQIAQARLLATYFRDDKVTLPDIFSQIQRQYPNHRVLLIADQFEELYTLCPDQKIRHSFLDTLLACFQSSPGNTNVLIATMRADFLGNALSYRPLVDVLQNADIKLGPMNHEELSQVITKPTEKLGVTFQDGLVERILEDVEDEPGHLPLLEFALTELWKRRKGKQLTHTAYEEIGEVKGALARHADQNYGRLSATEKEQVRQIFIQLVRPGEGTEDTRRLATKAELGEERWELVKKLADDRLVVTSQNAANQETVEVVHEALIHNWGELRQWINADRSFRAWQERLRAAMYQWQETQRDQGALLRGAALAEAKEKLKQRRDDLGKGEQEFIQASVALRDREKKQEQRRRQLTVSGLAGGLGIALGLAGLASVNWWSAEINQISAFTQSSDALLNVDGGKAVISSVKAAVKMQGQLWVDEKTHTQVKLTLLNTVDNVATPNTLGGHAKIVNSVSFSPDGKMLASASADNTVKLWDTRTGKEIKTLTGHTNAVAGISFSSDGKMLASASFETTVKLWDTRTGKEIKTLTGHRHWVNSVSFSRDGKMLASASADNTVKLWDTLTGKVIKTLTGHTNYVNGVSFSRDGKMLASASHDNTVKLWDTHTGKVINTFTGHTNPVVGVSISPDGKMLASTSHDNTVKLWDTRTLKEIKTLTGHTNPVFGVSISPDGKMLASASTDNTVKLWDTRTLKEIKTLTGHRNWVIGVSISPDGKMLASASADNTVKLWDTHTGKVIKTLAGHTDPVAGVSISPDGKMLASTSYDNTVKLWDTRTLKEIKTLTGHRNWVIGVNFSPDGKMLASASRDNTVKLWDTHTGKEIKTLTGHTNWVNSVSISPDGKMLASASTDNTVKLWDTRTFKEIKTLTGHTNAVFGVSISPDGKMLASGSFDNTVKLWDTRTLKEIKTLTGHINSVIGVSFSPDGKILASAGGDSTVKLWDTRTLKEIKTLIGHTNQVNGVSFSLDGKILASASHDNTVKLWRLDFDYLLKEGCNFIRKYYQTNPPDNESDKNLCNRVALLKL